MTDTLKEQEDRDDMIAILTAMIDDDHISVSFEEDDLLFRSAHYAVGVAPLAWKEGFTARGVNSIVIHLLQLEKDDPYVKIIA